MSEFGIIDKAKTPRPPSIWKIIMDKLPINPFGKTTQPEKKVEIAFVGLLMAAALCDGDIAPEESTELNALLTRTKTLRSHTADELSEISARVHSELAQKETFSETVQSYCSAIPKPAMAEALFAHCVDLVKCDTWYRREEQDFLGNISVWLELDEERAHKIFEIMELKNTH